MTWEQTAEVLAREIDRLQKENDRLSALIFPTTVTEGPKDELIGAWIGDMSNTTFDQWLRILKKDGELTIREDCGVPSKICLVMAAYETKTYESDYFFGYDINDVVDWVSTHGGLEFLSPAAEGGGAANGGKSKPLAITTIVTEAMRNQWHLAKSGESQALQAAILGLHTLAGEFPTPTWKTREDYLQATISEINEILGK